MNDREHLLREMNTGRFLLLLAMADLEEEEGDARRGRGWRWLAENGRWPLEVIRFEIEEEPDDSGPPRRVEPGTITHIGPGATLTTGLAGARELNQRRGGATGQQTPTDPAPEPVWEWWREKEAARFGCSLPSLLMDAIRKTAKTPKGKTCQFESASQALGCAATCAGLLIEAELLT